MYSIFPEDVQYFKHNTEYCSSTVLYCICADLHVALLALQLVHYTRTRGTLTLLLVLLKSSQHSFVEMNINIIHYFTASTSYTAYIRM